MTKRGKALQGLTLALALFGCLGLLSGCALKGNAYGAGGPSPTPTPTPQPSSHSVGVSWTASPSPNLQGYKVYRSQVSGGPYSNISGTLAATTLQFTDSSVSASATYFYVVTSIDTTGLESAPSMQVSAQIP